MADNKIIKAEELLNAIRDDISINGTNFARVKRHIENAPAVDAVEVVRCKDCKYYWLPQGFCEHERHEHQTAAVIQYDDDFCSYGERREGE